MTQERTHFGFRDVEWSEKSGLVRGVFERVAARYDIMNDVMSLGLHRLWKQHFVANIRGSEHSVCLDVAGGTGDIARKLQGRFGCPVMVCDINAAMLFEGRARTIDRGDASELRHVCSNAELLPLPDKSVDIYTIAFGIRNVTDIPKALSEAYRVLKHGGQFWCLEFSPNVAPALQKIYDAYSFTLLPKLGEWIAQDRESYQYLAESIRRFPAPAVFEKMIADAGFSRTKCESLSAGICTIHHGVKL